MVLGSLSNRIRRSGPNPFTETPNGQWFWPWQTERVTGGAISETRAMGLTAVFRCISIIAGTIGRLPLHVYEEIPDPNDSNRVIRRQARDPRFNYLRRRPNPEMSRSFFWSTVVGHEVQGNAYLFVVDNPFSGDIAELWPVLPSRIRVGRASNGQKVYQLDGKDAMIDYSQGGEIIHVPGLSVDGLVGMSPLAVAAEAIALGISAEEYAARFFTQDATPRGILYTDNGISQATADKLLADWHRNNTTLRQAHRTSLLTNGTKFQAISVNPDEAQLLEERRFQGEEIARLYGVPPHMLGMVDRTTSWGTGIEEMGRGFITFCLAFHLSRFEEAISDAMLLRELTDRYAQWDVDGLLRGNTLQRYQAYALGYGRWLTANDIRQDEDLEDVEGGDSLLAATNLAPIEDLIDRDLSAPSTGGNGGVGGRQ